MNEKIEQFKANVKEMKFHRYDFILWPKLWHNFNLKNKKKFKWQIFPFHKNYINKIPTSAGLYTFVIKPNIANHASGYVMYVGKTIKQTLQKRFQQYFYEMQNIKKRSKLIILLNSYNEKNLFFNCVDFKNKSKISKMEEDLFNAFLPPCNSDITGEVGKIYRGVL